MSGLRLDQLSEPAKQHALDKNRDWDVSDTDWWEYIFTDFIEVAKRLGFTVEWRFIWFSGFWSQGDGASFAGDFASTGRAGALIRDHAPKDEKLHALADKLDLLHFEMKLMHDAAVYARIAKIGRYVHSGTMIVETIGLLAGQEELDIGDRLYAQLEGCVENVARDLADWLYKQLEAEHECLTSDEALKEALEDHFFDEDGNLL